jgi:hypothetical protein
MTKVSYYVDGYDLSDLFLSSPISFGDDCRKHIPTTGSVVYTVWNQENDFIYVGISGLQDSLEKRNPLSRIQSHASGRKSGDQFCVYVHDFYVIPEIVKENAYEPSRRDLDRRTKAYIQRNLSYRFKSFQNEDSVKIVRNLEKEIKKGILTPNPPIFNGIEK